MAAEGRGAGIREIGLINAQEPTARVMLVAKGRGGGEGWGGSN